MRHPKRRIPWPTFKYLLCQRVPYCPDHSVHLSRFHINASNRGVASIGNQYSGSVGSDCQVCEFVESSFGCWPISISQAWKRPACKWVFPRERVCRTDYTHMQTGIDNVDTTFQLVPDHKRRAIGRYGSNSAPVEIGPREADKLPCDPGCK